MEKTEVSAEQIERVSQMEAALVRLNDAITTVEDALDIYEQMWDDYRALDKYYSGKAWWEDLEADNQGFCRRIYRAGCFPRMPPMTPSATRNPCVSA